MRVMRILGGNCAIYIGIFFNGTFNFLQYIITNTTLYTVYLNFDFVKRQDSICTSSDPLDTGNYFTNSVNVATYIF